MGGQSPYLKIEGFQQLWLGWDAILYMLLCHCYQNDITFCSVHNKHIGIDWNLFLIPHVVSETTEKQSTHFAGKVGPFYSLLRDHQLILRSLRALRILRMNLWLYYNSVHRLIDLTLFLLQSPIEKEKKLFVQKGANPSIIINH